MAVIITADFYVRNQLRADPGSLYLFGDNLDRRGLGGQAAEMRGEPNAFGIAVKYHPTTNNDAYFSDRQLERNKTAITTDINHALRYYKKLQFKNLIIPQIGAGRAMLPQKAPETYDWLLTELKRLENEVIAHHNTTL